MSRNERWRRFRKSNRTWDSSWLPALAGLAGGTFAAMAGAALQDALQVPGLPGGRSLETPAWAFLFGFVALGLPALLVRYTAARVVRELRALINVRPLTGSEMLTAGTWAIDAVCAEQLLVLVNEGPAEVVECGSGHSTLLIAQRLEEQAHGHVTAIDHLDEFACRTRGWIRERGLEHRATVVHAPIVEREVEGRRVPWYDGEALEGALPDRIDLLVVDGPPCQVGPMARWPAVPLLRDRLAPGATIHMDDGDRVEERRIAFDWKRRLGAEIQYVPGGKGGWILRLPG